MKEFNFSKQKIQNALENFREYSKDPRFQKDTKEREERKTFFKKITNKEINELSFSEIIKNLWAA